MSATKPSPTVQKTARQGWGGPFDTPEEAVMAIVQGLRAGGIDGRIRLTAVPGQAGTAFVFHYGDERLREPLPQGARVLAHLSVDTRDSRFLTYRAQVGALHAVTLPLDEIVPILKVALYRGKSPIDPSTGAIEVSKR